MTDRPRIAVFSGPTATIQNSPPLRTSGPDTYLRPQRLAAPLVAYIEAYSAHPLESDARSLYRPPDGYLDADGAYVERRDSPLPPDVKGVYRVELDPADGLLLLPYVARTVHGNPWVSAELSPLAEEAESRQTFYPDASRLYEEIDRFGLDNDGRNQLLSRKATYTFIRALPSSGYRSEPGARAAGLPQPERRGHDYFGYFPRHLHSEPGSQALLRATNIVQRSLANSDFLGAQWLEGSPTTEETLYWLNLLIDTKVPLVGHSAQRPHGTLSGDGDRNIVDGVQYITSRVWADAEGHDNVGAVMIVDEVIYASREVAKTDARPGNYVATGGHGGIVGSTGAASGRPVLTYRPVRRHTSCSALRMSELPTHVEGIYRDGEGAFVCSTLRVLGTSRLLEPDEMPAVEIVKYARYSDACCGASEVDALLAHFANSHRLAGIVGEGMNPYGGHHPATDEALKRAAFSGFPVVKCGRGNTSGFTPPQPPWFVGGGNLTATKARILLTACLLKFGALPPARDPYHPTEFEEKACVAAVERFQDVFNTH